MKLFLNLSKEEQRTRFLRRIDLPEKNWKFSSARRQGAGALGRLPGGVLARCSRTRAPSWAPWYVIPADRKWFARLAAAAVIASTLIEIDPRYPQVSAETREQLVAARADLVAQAPKGAKPDPFEAKAARERERAKRKEDDEGTELVVAALETKGRRK